MTDTILSTKTKPTYLDNDFDSEMYKSIFGTL